MPSRSRRIVFRVGVGAPGRDDVHDPAQRTGRPNPRNAGHQQPDDSDQNSAVIDLPRPGNQKTQHTCQKWIAHLFENLRAFKYEGNSARVQNIRRASSVLLMQERSEYCGHFTHARLLNFNSSGSHSGKGECSVLLFGISLRLCVRYQLMRMRISREDAKPRKVKIRQNQGVRFDS